MAQRKYVSLNRLSEFLDNLKNLFATKDDLSSEIADKADIVHNHDDAYYTKNQIDVLQFITLNNVNEICKMNTENISNREHWFQLCNDTLTESGVWQRTTCGSKPVDIFEAREGWKGYFWFYVSDITKISDIYWELSSSATHTGNCVRFFIGEGVGREKLVNGWNKIEFTLHDSTNLTNAWNDEYSKSFNDSYSYYLGGGMYGNVDWQHINFVRLVVSPAANATDVSYYINAMTLYDPYDVEQTKKQIWINDVEDSHLSYDSTTSTKPTVSWTPNNVKEGDSAIKITINDVAGSQVLAYREIDSISPFKLRKFSAIIRLTNGQHTNSGAFYISTKNGSTAQILCSTESLTANNYIVVRFDGVLENWWKCYGFAGFNTTDSGRYNSIVTKHYSYPLGTRTSVVNQNPISFLQIGFGSEAGVLPSGTNIEIWGVEQ